LSSEKNIPQKNFISGYSIDYNRFNPVLKVVKRIIFETIIVTVRNNRKKAVFNQNLKADLISDIF